MLELPHQPQFFSSLSSFRRPLTASATADLVKQAGGQLVGCAFIVELTELKGRGRLPDDIQVESLIHYS